MNRLTNFEQFTLTQQQQNNITGGTTYIRPMILTPALMPATLTSSVNTWSTETTTTTNNITNQISNFPSTIRK